MQGKTTIQLFDAKTQKEVQRVEDKNLITNAYKRYIEDYINNYHIGPVFSGLPNWINATPYDMTRGVILFDTPLAESADKIYPANQECVGHAGGDYSGTDIYRGDYNAAESGDIEDGYRHVWDFATDKANGTIACVCLTTLNGGNCGYKSQTTLLAEYPQGGITASGNNPYSNILSSVENNYCKPVGFTNNHMKFFVQVGYSYADTVRVRGYWGKKSGIGFKEKLGMFNSNQYDELIIPCDNPWYVSSALVNDVLYVLRAPFSESISPVLKVYDISDFSEVASVTLNTPTGRVLDVSNFEYSPMFGIIGDELIVKERNANNVLRFNKNTGAYLGDLSHPVSNLSRVYNFTKEWVRLANTSSTYYLYNGTNYLGPFLANPNTGLSQSYPDFVQAMGENSPVICSFGYNSTTLRETIGVFAPCLFSINNLSTPVVKDDTKTMKVTYDITW